MRIPTVRLPIDPQPTKRRPMSAPDRLRPRLGLSAPSDGVAVGTGLLLLAAIGLAHRFLTETPTPPAPPAPPAQPPKWRPPAPPRNGTGH